MDELTIRYWRDIPSMVAAGRGRKAVKAMLPERFEQAIDRCAMKVGARDADAYLAEWRVVTVGPAQGEQQQLVAALIAELEEAHPPERLRELIEQDGWAQPR
ncbi:MAG: virulence factor [Neomegalonema sp.]|nr:virulence factor [Neomegalonema sp.]